MSFQIIMFRLLLGLVLSGLIGMERESKNRPAGLRTHILVCIGAVIVMLTSEHIFEKYGYVADIDIARLGAQVISGIGFLGAGTIIRQGANVKGLTTAATLWAVACVGLAIGIGFYTGAVSGAVIIYFTVILLRKFEKTLEKKKSNLDMCVEIESASDKIGKMIELFLKYNIEIANIEILNNDIKNNYIIKFTLKSPPKSLYNNIIKELTCFYDSKA